MTEEGLQGCRLSISELSPHEQFSVEGSGVGTPKVPLWGSDDRRRVRGRPTPEVTPNLRRRGGREEGAGFLSVRESRHASGLQN